jgi:hypothetical protein
MKVVIEKKTVEVEEIKYFADDGTECASEAECKTYERRKQTEYVEKMFRKLSPKRINDPLVYEFYGEEDADIFLIKAECEYDYDVILSDYFANKVSSMDLEGLRYNKPVSFPAELIICSGYDWVTVWGTKEQFKEEIKRLYEEFCE